MYLLLAIFFSRLVEDIHTQRGKEKERGGGGKNGEKKKERDERRRGGRGRMKFRMYDMR